MKIRGMAAAAVFFAALLLNGCNIKQPDTWKPQEPDAISVSSDGSLTETIKESLNEAYYDADELETMIRSSVEEYNQSNGEDSVKIKSLKNQDDTVTLKLKYASGKDFASFNNLEFYQGSIINAQLEGYLFDVSFYQIQDGEVKGAVVDVTEVFNDMSADVLIVQAPLEVHVDGDVTFISTNAQILSDSTVNANGQMDARDAQSVSLLLPSGSIHDENETYYEQQKAQNRVYIIYEQNN